MRNVDASVTEGFGREWSTFTQGESELEANERQRQFDQYFRIFPWDDLPAHAAAFTFSMPATAPCPSRGETSPTTRTSRFIWRA